MWYRIVAIANAKTEWEPRWGLRCDGDGPYVKANDPGDWSPMTFPTVVEAVIWVRRYADDKTFVELPPHIHPLYGG